MTDLPGAPQGGNGRLRPTPASGIPLAGSHPQHLQSIPYLSASSSFRGRAVEGLVIHSPVDGRQLQHPCDLNVAHWVIHFI